jgi:CheY-like chemotaxis protein
VTTAGSARQAHELLEQTTPDVLVSDIGMPGEDGYTLIRQIRALGVTRGVWFAAVALTGYAQASDRNRALSAGYQVHLTKPIDPDRLVEAVAELAGRGSRS